MMFNSVLSSILSCVVLLGMLSAMSITYIIMHMIISAMTPISVINSKILSKDVLSKFKEYVRREHFHYSVIILDWDESNSLITYRLCGHKFIAKLGVDGFYRV